jgi:hypothetical protein
MRYPVHPVDALTPRSEVPVLHLVACSVFGSVVAAVGHADVPINTAKRHCWQRVQWYMYSLGLRYFFAKLLSTQLCLHSFTAVSFEAIEKISGDHKQSHSDRAKDQTEQCE